MQFTWTKDNFGGYQAAMPDNVTLVVSPDRLAKGFTPKAARGTQWRAACSHWDESTRCLSRFGRDAYMDLRPSYKAAMRLAEAIYMEAIEPTKAA